MYRSILIFAAIAVVSVIATFRGVAFSATEKQVYIEYIKSEKQTGGLIVELSEKAEYQVVQIDKKQILIAIKGGVAAETMNSQLENKNSIKSFSIDRMPGDVLALVIYTQNEIKHINSKWQGDSKRLMVNFKPNKSAHSL